MTPDIESSLNFILTLKWELIFCFSSGTRIMWLIYVRAMCDMWPVHCETFQMLESAFFQSFIIHFGFFPSTLNSLAFLSGLQEIYFPDIPYCFLYSLISLKTISQLKWENFILRHLSWDQTLTNIGSTFLTEKHLMKSPLIPVTIFIILIWFWSADCNF